MQPGLRRCLTSLALAIAGAASLLAQSNIPTVDRAKLAKLAEPWPDAEVVKARRTEAEQRRLFAGDEPFAFTLSADFKTINKDRNPESKNDYPGVLTVDDPAGVTTLHVKLRPRGHLRRKAVTCSFVPLRVEFDKAEVKGTLFDGQKTLKLVTHCNSDKVFEQYILKEYASYRMLNLLTPRSFRARLAHGSYVQTARDAVPADAAGAKPFVTRVGMFLEDEDDVARRAEARMMEIPRVMFKELEPDQLSIAMTFEYMIGNTDYSIFALHNVKLLRTEDKTIYAVPYDFDLSGVVNTTYAAPLRTLGQQSVRDRIFRGPCRPEAEVAPIIDKFKAKKDDILAVLDAIPGMEDDSKRDVRQYLQGFFSTIASEKSVRHTFVSGECSTKSYM